jgi:two-component system sensor kinase FixL
LDTQYLKPKPISKHLMKNSHTPDTAYREAVAALSDCEARYDEILKSHEEDGSHLKRTLSRLKEEIGHRRRLEGDLLTAVENERQRIGQDLHDDLCQHLGATALLVGSLTKEITAMDPNLGRKLEKVPNLISEAIQNCRNLARGLNPVTILTAGLPGALEELTARVPMETKFSWPRSKRIKLEPSVALHLYRIAEEAVGNAVKHAKAKSIGIGLVVKDQRVVMDISDDGQGIKLKRQNSGMGLRNMQYRAHVIGGELNITKLDSGGTCVQCTLPFVQ